MPIAFNLLLREAGLDLAQVRLLRHADAKAVPGHCPYELWRDQRAEFDLYQSIQSPTNRSKLNTTHWDSFVVTLRSGTRFAGLRLFSIVWIAFTLIACGGTYVDEKKNFERALGFYLSGGCAGRA